MGFKKFGEDLGQAVGIPVAEGQGGQVYAVIGRQGAINGLLHLFAPAFRDPLRTDWTGPDGIAGGRTIKPGLTSRFIDFDLDIPMKTLALLFVKMYRIYEI